VYVVSRYTNPDNDHCEDPGVHQILDPVADCVDRVQTPLKVGVEISEKKNIVLFFSQIQYTKFIRVIATKAIRLQR
jgi:hypothetical protein